MENNKWNYGLEIFGLIGTLIALIPLFTTAPSELNSRGLIIFGIFVAVILVMFILGYG